MSIPLTATIEEGDGADFKGEVPEMIRGIRPGNIGQQFNFLTKKKERKANNTKKEEVIPLGLGDPLGAVGGVE